MRVIFIVLMLYLIIINLIAIILMAIDKNRAIKKQWRIKESALFAIAIVGGSVGSVIGMQKFRHKTKHMAFVIGMPLILILHIIGAILCYLYLY